MTPSFEQQLTELEKVVEKLERGDLPLEDNLKLFERGVQLSTACRQQLAAAESRVQVLLNPEAATTPQIEDLALADLEDLSMEDDAFEANPDEE